MPEGRKRLIQATKSMLSGKQDKPRLFPAVLGAYVDGIKQIKVQPRPDFVWCRMRGSTSEVIQAFNDSVSLHWDLPVLVFRDPLSPGIWKVYGRDIAQYDDWAGASYLPPHADAHSFGGSSNTGSDPVWMFKRQYMPMLPRPVVSGTLSIFIEADFWYYQGRYYWWPGSGTTSLAPYMPTGAMNGVFVTVYMDGPKKIPQFLKGTEFAAWYPPTDPSDFITLPTPVQGPPLAAVFLTTGTTWIGWGEIYDLRSPQEPLGSLTASGSFIAHDEGLLLGSVTHINFTGAGVSASISGSYVTVNVPSVMPGGLVGWDHGVVIGTGTILEAGEGLRMTISGTVLHLDFAGGGPSRSYFLCTSGSTVAPYNRMLTVHHNMPEEYFSATVAVTGTMVKGFITDAGEPAADLLLDGIHHVHVHANRTAGTMDVRLCFQLFRYTAGGAAILLLTSEWSNLLTNVEAEYDIETDSPTIDIDITDRLLIKVFAQRFSGGSAPDVRIGVHGTTASRYESPLPGGGGGVVNPPITGSFVIAEEGTVLGSATELNFIGVTVTATLVGPRANITIVGGTVNPPITGSFVIAEEGAVLGSATELNFIGATVTATLVGPRADITIVGGGAGPAGAGGVMGWDEGIPLGTGTILNVVGKGGQLSLSGTVLQLSISGSSLYDEGAYKGYFDEVNFVGAGVVATLAGSRATVTVAGGGTVDPPITGSFVITEEGAVLGSATELNFIGVGVTATLVGRRADITIVGTGGGSSGGTGTAYRLEVGLALPLAGNYYKVPDPPYVTGSLVVFLDGLAQRPGTDYVEDYASSGTYRYISTPPTGSFHLAAWDKPVTGGLCPEPPSYKVIKARSFI